MNKLIVIILFLAISITSMAQTDSERLLKRADYYYDKGNYCMAYESYKKAADNGNAIAMRKLAYSFLTGKGVDGDTKKATEWYLKAAEMGDATAMYMLVNSYYNGIGVEHSSKKAQEWLHKAADNGSIEGLRLLSQCYHDGNGEVQDTIEAKILAMRADSIEDAAITLSTQTIIEANKTDITQKSKINIDDGQPQITILYPENQFLFHEDKLKIRYFIHNAIGRHFNVAAMVNGEFQPATRSVTSADAIDVDLPKKDCLVQLILKDDNGQICGEPTSLQLRWDNSFEQIILPNLYVFAVGIGDYHDKNLPPLKYTVKDCNDFVTAVIQKKGKPYENVYVRKLLDSHAVLDSLYEGLEWLKRNVTQNDVAMFFYAGHGFKDNKDDFYFANFDGDTEKSYKNMSAFEFTRRISDVSGKVILFIDACYSAALLQNTRSASTEHFIEQLNRAGNGMIMYASSSADTKSREDNNWQNGVFTKVLLEALNGALVKPNREGLSANELGYYVEERVNQLTEGKQIPKYINPKNIDNFNIFLYDKE
ncbi:MAG: caspase family protein [Muribaculaceae bacterium]|jgi:TPR repeat protein|nr:caspase family protein [Muribaculaceae bacterium]